MKECLNVFMYDIQFLNDLTYHHQNELNVKYRTEDLETLRYWNELEEYGSIEQNKSNDA